MTAPATEKAAPIPADDAVGVDIQRLADRCAQAVYSSIGKRDITRPIKEAIVDAVLADRASQEERIREDEARLDWLEANSNVHVQYEGWEEDVWEVYRVNGGRSDREWSKIAEGANLRDAIDLARLRGDAS